LCAINLDWFQKVKVHHPILKIVPEKKLCSNCRNKIQGLLNISIKASSSSDSEAEAIQTTNFDIRFFCLLCKW